MKKTFTFLAIIMIAFAYSSYAQSSKSLYKTGVAFAKSHNYTDAINVFTRAIELSPEMTKAYVARGKSYEMLDSLPLARKDFVRASALEPEEEEYYYFAASISLKMEDYEEAVVYADNALKLKKKYLEVANVKTVSLYRLDKMGLAEVAGVYAFDIKKNYDTYYNLGLIYLAQKKLTVAQQYFQLAHDKNDEKIGALIAMAQTYFDQSRYDECANVTFQALQIDPTSKEALWLRASAYAKNHRYQDAINDLSQITVYHPNEDYINDIYLKRAQIYYDFNQYMNAVNDYSIVIRKDSSNAEAYFGRAKAYEVIQQVEPATADYEMLESMGLEGDKYKVLLAVTSARLFDLKREDVEPEIFVEEPTARNSSELEVLIGESATDISGYIKDASKIEKLTINGKPVSVVEISGKYNFNVLLSLLDVEEVVFVAEDTYGNSTTSVYKIIRTEVDDPVISLITPVANDDGQIYIDTDEPIVYIEGVIMDASIISSIVIDSVNASYSSSSINPTFSANLSIANKNSIWIEVVDIYGNSTRTEYLLNREGAKLAKDNPMGRTWVVFIENSNYESFASLEGPTKDVTMMKSALSKYQIHNIIHKRDMTKVEMERFFSIELRDLVRKNHVNSIVVWYAGHGKFINNTGYWIPIDANRDDEFAYFSINTLKSAMQAYSTVITHTLVVTDACESGPTFYQAMRSGLKIRDCGDWNATKFKSSQVFSSAGYELASDNSQFTKTFASSLQYNPNSCIPIESIVKKVTTAVARKKQQKPQFGKIDGLADEDGTFFFIKRK